MAYQQDYLDDENDKSKWETAQPQDSGDVISPSNSISSNGGTSSPQSSSPQPGTGFTNLSKYVDANKEQSSDMAGGITSDIQNNVNKTKSNASDFEKASNSLLDSSKVTDNGAIGQLNDPNANFSDLNFQNNYKNNIKGWKGPNQIEDLSGYSDLSKEFGKNAQDVKYLDTPGSIMNLTKEKYGKNTPYTQGENTLDSFLIGSGAGADTLGKFKSSYSQQNPEGSFQNLADMLGKHLTSAKETSEKTKADTEGALKSALGSYDTKFKDLSSSVGKEKESADLATQDLKNRAKNGDPAALKELGISSQAFNTFKSFGGDLSSLISGPKGYRSLGDVSSDKDVSNYNSLLGLTGGQNNYDFSKTGNSAPTYSKSDKISEILDANNIFNDVNNATNSGNISRENQYKKAMAASQVTDTSGFSSKEISDNAALLGLSPEDYSYAVQNGLLVKGGLGDSYVTKGKSLNYGDVAKNFNGDYLSKWDQIVSDLGLSSSPSLQDSQDEGNAFNVSTSDIMNEIAKRRKSDTTAAVQPMLQLGSTGNARDKGGQDVISQLGRMVKGYDPTNDTNSQPSVLKQFKKLFGR